MSAVRAHVEPGPVGEHEGCVGEPVDLRRVGEPEDIVAPLWVAVDGEHVGVVGRDHDQRLVQVNCLSILIHF